MNVMDRSYQVFVTKNSEYGLCTAGWFFKLLPSGERAYMLRDAQIDRGLCAIGQRMRVTGFEVAVDGSSQGDRLVSWTTSPVVHHFVQVVLEEL